MSLNDPRVSSTPPQPPDLPTELVAGGSVPVRRNLLALARSASVLSIAGIPLSIATQLALPPVLLAKWGDLGYAFAVAVQGFASYVSVADAGVLLSLSRRLTVLRVEGNETSALSLTRGGLRAFAGLATGGTVVVFLAFLVTGRRVWHDLALACGIKPGMALAAALAQVISGATSLALGGWTSSVDLSRSRYSRVPAFALARAALVTVATLGCAILGLSAAVTLLSVSGLGVAFECLRFALAMHSEPSLRDVNPSPVRGILHEARGSLVFYLATATQNGLQPYVAAAVSSKVLSVAVPARTLSNSARSLSTAVVNVIWVPVAARLAELRDSAERLRFWRRNSPTLWTVHLAGIVGLLGLAPLVVPRWLPAKSHDILAILPFYCAEQGAYIAAIPSIVLLQATGRFGALGAVTLATAIATVAGTLLLTPAYGAAGFAGASAASAVLILAPALVTLEWLYWRETGVSATSSLAPRVGLALLVGACALPYAQHRWTTVLGLTVVLVIVTWHTLRARAKTVPVGA